MDDRWEFTKETTAKGRTPICQIRKGSCEIGCGLERPIIPVPTSSDFQFLKPFGVSKAGREGLFTKEDPSLRPYPGEYLLNLPHLCKEGTASQNYISREEFNRSILTCNRRYAVCLVCAAGLACRVMDASDGLNRGPIKSHEDQDSHKFSYLYRDLMQQQEDAEPSDEVNKKYKIIEELQEKLRTQTKIDKQVLQNMFDEVKHHLELIKANSLLAQDTGSSSPASHLGAGRGSDNGENCLKFVVVCLPMSVG